MLNRLKEIFILEKKNNNFIQTKSVGFKDFNVVNNMDLMLFYKQRF